ncbi:hypothetical protein ARMGADRAFT_1032810 [Armillaria gallica]|uniref:Uncharacterized protein n=1 Tax=Armillaria gallica TaxID=47427 RepID=A0A2H3D834_ARMGA|nr:hypothetical protein ARMGADRAFT_1032810 [Armillaria gallica]
MDIHILDYYAHTTGFDDHVWLLITLMEAPSTYLGCITIWAQSLFPLYLIGSFSPWTDVLAIHPRWDTWPEDAGVWSRVLIPDDCGTDTTLSEAVASVASYEAFGPQLY